MCPKSPCPQPQPPQPLQGVFYQSSFLEAQTGCTEVVGLGFPTPLGCAGFAQMAAFLCAGLSTRQSLPAESWHQEFGLGSLSVEEHSPWITIPVSQGILKTLQGPTLKTLCQHSNLLCCKSNWKCVQSAFPPKNQRKKRKAQGPELSLPFLLLPGGDFYGATPVSHH